MRNNRNSGFTLLELLVVIAVFSVLAVLATQAIFLTLRGALKSESIRQARENLDYAMGVMERQIRNASEIVERTSPDSICDGTTAPVMQQIRYKDQDGVEAYFQCETDATGKGFIASYSAVMSPPTKYRLTNENINVTNCTFVCNPGSSGSNDPPSYDITLDAVVTGGRSVEGASLSLKNKIFLRTY